MLAFPMGEMRMIKGSGDYGTIIKADQIGGSEYSFAEMDGMVFAGEEGAIAMTRWTEGKPFAVKTENIKLWEPPRFDADEKRGRGASCNGNANAQYFSEVCLGGHVGAVQKHVSLFYIAGG